MVHLKYKANFFMSHVILILSCFHTWKAFLPPITALVV